MELQVAPVAGAVPRSSASAVLAALTDRLAAAVGGHAIALQAGTLVGCDAPTEGASWAALRLTVLACRRLQRVALAATALVGLVAHPVAAAQRAGGDAPALGRAHMSGNADAGVGRRADSVGTVIGADGLTAAVDMRVALVPLAADLDATHVWSGAVAHELVAGVAQERSGAKSQKLNSSLS